MDAVRHSMRRTVTGCERMQLGMSESHQRVKKKWLMIGNWVGGVLGWTGRSSGLSCVLRENGSALDSDVKIFVVFVHLCLGEESTENATDRHFWKLGSDVLYDSKRENKNEVTPQLQRISYNKIIFCTAGKFQNARSNLSYNLIFPN